MNKAPTINILREYFTNLTTTGDELIRAERMHNDKPVGVFYFDFSESVTRPEFDILQYMQERIAADFYKHEGSLQWNYYIYFVLDKNNFKSFRQDPKSAVIEADRTFARKFIREQSNLEAEIKRPLASILYATEPSQDIASRWVEELTDAGLEGIADPAIGYDTLVRRVVLGTSTSRTTSPRVLTTHVENGRVVQSLNWDQDRFRTYPLQKNFEFGTVNLIRGVNGTGKTSLLEAVELCICGGIRRQDGKKPNGARLYIQYSGDPGPEICPASDHAKYRERDQAWYGGHYRRNNQLCHNFGRFNFFDSDAAFKLSEATNRTQITEAINALLLGELATMIEERMRQFQERFAREERKLDRQVKGQRKDIEKATLQISQLEEITDTRDALLRELKVKADACAWKKIPTRIKLDDVALLREAAEDVSTRIDQAIERLPWLGQLSIISINRESDHIREALKEIGEKNGLAKKTLASLERSANRLNELDTELKLLLRLQEYHRASDAMTLLGLTADMQKQKQLVTQLKEALRLLHNLDLSTFREELVTLDELASQHNSDAVKRNRAIAKLRERESSLQSKFDTIKAVVQQIKGLGQRFCEINPHSNDCPLCGAPYENLAAQIAALEYNAPLESALQELTAQLSQEQASLTELLNRIKQASLIRQAAEILFSEAQLARQSTKSVVSILISLDEKLRSEKTKLEELSAKQKRFELAGFVEDELKQLLETAGELHALPRAKLMKREEAKALSEDRTHELDLMRRDVREKQKLQKEIDTDIRRILKRSLRDADIEDGGVELERRKTLTMEVLDEMAHIQKTLSISDSAEFSSVKTRLIAFSKATERIEKALKAVEEKDALMQQLAASLVEAKTELEKIEPQHGRAKGAYTILTKLLGDDYKAAYIETVAREHKAKISTFFSRIHAPHEFKGVSLGSDVLLQRDTGAECPVSEISTGQRAALALSIFLSLNSSVSEKAPWLLFDDPIVHVDDLNILSFFDTLRDLVLLGGRQVFFATANTKIADLFSRKFDFLGGSFKEFRLQR